MQSPFSVSAIRILNIAIHARLIDWQVIVLDRRLLVANIIPVVAEVTVIVAINFLNIGLVTVSVDIVHAVQTLLIIIVFICVAWHLVAVLVQLVFVEVDGCAIGRGLVIGLVA